MSEDAKQTEVAARPVHPDGRIQLTAEEARQGQIILNTRGRKAVFFGGLAAFIILAVVGGFLIA